MVAGSVADCRHSSGCGIVFRKNVNEMRKSQLINRTGCFVLSQNNIWSEKSMMVLSQPLYKLFRNESNFVCPLM